MTNPENEQFLRLIRSLESNPHLTHGPEQDAIFDPFMFEGEEFYQYYNASIECWKIGRAVDPIRRRSSSLPVETNPWIDQGDLEAISALAFMPHPRVPEKIDEPVFQGPFWYKDRQFLWMLDDLQWGWQLVIGRQQPCDVSEDISALAAA